MANADPKCGNCRYKVKRKNSNPAVIECHVYAPKPLVSSSPDVTAVWPIVQKDDWCNEWNAENK